MKEISSAQWFYERLAEKDAEIARLKGLLIGAAPVLRSLLTRAADALEEESWTGKTDLMTKDPWALIAELRKAAQ